MYFCNSYLSQKGELVGRYEARFSERVEWGKFLSHLSACNRKKGVSRYVKCCGQKLFKSSFTVSGVKTPTAVAESAQIVDTYSVATALLTNVDIPGGNIVNCPPSSDHLGAASQSLSVRRSGRSSLCLSARFSVHL